MFCRSRRILPTLLTTVSLLTSVAFANATELHPQLSKDAIVRTKKNTPVTHRMKQFVSERDGDKAKVWVFFTDKNILSRAQFDSAATGIILSQKQIDRRTRVDRADIRFADLPVNNTYIRQIESLGGQVRRVSRWLNAASFELKPAVLDRIASLPFVASLRPVAKYKRSDEPIGTDYAIQAPDITATFDELNYGQSLSQLNQIYVPNLHHRGFDASGVILAIFDSGYRKTHDAFAQHYLDGRVLAEYDFIFNDENTANEAEDTYSQWNHGTNCWSIAAGFKDGIIYGPAYRASFLLAKTEDMRDEYVGEEDNWIAALEWADSHGADVITSSVGYLDWYTYEDMDGATAPITVAANTAAGLGILLVNAIGNEGPAPGTLIAPADAYDMLAVGGVDPFDNLTVFSSRGPTYDGRIKPEVCARGSSTFLATATGDNFYSQGSGTSFATPLVAGAACLLIQAHPEYSPQQIRQALMETACQADAPDNNYGWGIIDADLACFWGAQISADTRSGNAPLTVQFEGNSGLNVSSWTWSFGDGGTSNEQNPLHVYDRPGAYDVSLTAQTEYGEVVNERLSYIKVFADTLTFESDSAFAGQQTAISVSLTNSQSLDPITIPFAVAGDLTVRFDSVTFGDRTGYFEYLQYLQYDPWNLKFTVRLNADVGGGSPPLSPGSGEVARIYLTIDAYQLGDLAANIDTIDQSFDLALTSPDTTYVPVVKPGGIRSRGIQRADADYSGRIDIEDAVYIVNYVFNGGPEPQTVQSADVNADLNVNIDDIVYLVDAMFRDGPPPPTP